MCLCVAGSSRLLHGHIPQLCDNSAGSTPAFQGGLYAQDLFFSKGCNQEGTEVTCCLLPLPAGLLFVCCDSLVPNPAGSQLCVLEKTELLRRAAPK